jgi:hypothetical protein
MARPMRTSPESNEERLERQLVAQALILSYEESTPLDEVADQLLASAGPRRFALQKALARLSHPTVPTRSHVVQRATAALRQATSISFSRCAQFGDHMSGVRT